jgi:hypothetical protein
MTWLGLIWLAARGAAAAGRVAAGQQSRVGRVYRRALPLAQLPASWNGRAPRPSCSAGCWPAAPGASCAVRLTWVARAPSASQWHASGVGKGPEPWLALACRAGRAGALLVGLPAARAARAAALPTDAARQRRRAAAEQHPAGRRQGAAGSRGRRTMRLRACQLSSDRSCSAPGCCSKCC